MGVDLDGGPLGIRPWMLREIASSCGGGSPLARMLRADIAFIGVPELADMGGVEDDDPRWKGPVEAYRRLLTDTSAEATARIRRHLLSTPAVEEVLYDDLLVDPVTRAVAERLGNSTAGIAMLTRSHEDMALQQVDASDDDHTVAISIEDVEYEEEVRPFLAIAFEIAESVQLEPGRLEILFDVPDVIGSALAGRPLRDFLTHPLLDPFDVRIRGLSGESLELDYDGMAVSPFD